MAKKAVIFDMDGVIIDSERLWMQAEAEVFSGLGVSVTDEFTEVTKSMTTLEVTRFWFTKFPWKNKSLETVEQLVVSRVVELIDTEDCRITGAKEFLELLKANDYKIGLATNSPDRVIPAVLKKLDVLHVFDAVSSAEFEVNGKPDPAIYLTTAAKLKIEAHQCIAIEDSYSGVVAAKNAGMTVVVFTNGNTEMDFELADFKIDHFGDFDMNILH